MEIYRPEEKLAYLTHIDPVVAYLVGRTGETLLYAVWELDKGNDDQKVIRKATSEIMNCVPGLVMIPAINELQKRINLGMGRVDYDLVSSFLIGGVHVGEDNKKYGLTKDVPLVWMNYAVYFLIREGRYT